MPKTPFRALLAYRAFEHCSLVATTLCCAVYLFLTPGLGAAEEFLTCRALSSSYKQFESSLQAQAVYLNGPYGATPEISVIENPAPNAFAIPSSNKILVTSGMLEIVKSSGQQAFVLAHELGHMQQAPGCSKINQVIFDLGCPLDQDREEAADIFAAKLLMDRNMPLRDALGFLEHITQRTNSHHLKSRHQKLTVSLRQL